MTANIDNCKISLDTNYYCGAVDYELGIEYEDHLDEDIIRVLQKLIEKTDGK